MINQKVQLLYLHHSSKIPLLLCGDFHKALDTIPTEPLFHSPTLAFRSHSLLLSWDSMSWFWVAFVQSMAFQISSNKGVLFYWLFLDLHWCYWHFGVTLGYHHETPWVGSWSLLYSPWHFRFHLTRVSSFTDSFWDLHWCVEVFSLGTYSRQWSLSSTPRVDICRESKLSFSGTSLDVSRLPPSSLFGWSSEPNLFTLRPLFNWSHSFTKSKFIGTPPSGWIGIPT